MLAATPLLLMHARWRMWQLNARKSSEIQEVELLRLVRKARSTRFGRDHDFGGITGVNDFQQRVPLRSYDDFWNDYWKSDFPLLKDCTWPGTSPYFALTSGTTTGVTKYIPCSHEMLRANSRAGQDLLIYHLLNHPRSRILGGKSFMLGGSTNLREEAPDIYSGDLSGIEANEIPWWARPYVFPSRKLALLEDWEKKIDQLARLSLEEDIRALSGTPSWLLVFLDKLAELRPDVEQRLVNYYPGLELLVHGGIDFKPYARRFSELLKYSKADVREVYPASEGFIAIADQGQGEGLRLIVDNGIFYEFVPAEELGTSEPSRHWLADVEVGIDYAIVLSTCAGTWSYVLGDTIRFVDLTPPRVLVTGRTSYVLSTFGEHLIAAEIEEAVATAANAINASIADYCVAPIFPETPGAKGAHCYIVEFIEQPIEAKRITIFRNTLDKQLRMLNADYDAHRTSNYGLRPPNVKVVPGGTFRTWMKSRDQLGGQHKVPRIINNPELFADLQQFLSD